MVLGRADASVAAAVAPLAGAQAHSANDVRELNAHKGREGARARTRS